jgi:hypothetical protein
MAKWMWKSTVPMKVMTRQKNKISRTRRRIRRRRRMRMRMMAKNLAQLAIERWYIPWLIM